MTDIVERLRGPTRVTQYDSAGRLETYEASPSQLDLDAANEIERLRAALRRIIDVPNAPAMEYAEDVRKEIEAAKSVFEPR